MKRIAIIGCGGAGKSTFARRLGPMLDLPVYHLDGLFWRPGWTETPRDEWAALQRELVTRPQWVIDGNYGGTMPIRLEAADTIIFFDFPRLLCTWRVIKRVLVYRGRTRPDVAAGCPERFDPDFLKWIWTYRDRRRPGILTLLEQYAPGRKIVTLRSPGEAESLLRQFAASPQEHHAPGLSHPRI
jgi:adenylate kinase family enzyme